MSMYSLVSSDDVTDIAEDRSSAALRHMSAEQLRHLGSRQVVYLRSTWRSGEQTFVIHGADGVPLAVTETVDMAVQMAVEHGLEFVAVH
jgi:hypothetical protein